MRIRTLFLLTFSLIAAATAVFFYRWTTDEIRPSYLKVVEESLVDTSWLLAAMIQERMLEEGWDFTDLEEPANQLRSARFHARIYDSEKFESDLQFYVTDRTGIVRFHSHDSDQIGEDFSRWLDVGKTLRGEYGARSTRLDPDDPSSSHLHIAAPVKVENDLIAVVTVIKPIEWPYRFIEESRRHIFLGAIVLAVCSIGAAVGLSFWLSRPLERLTAHAQRIRKGERSPVPSPGGATEIRRLHGAFEEMRQSLEGKKYVESYIANLTHEIKSPLAGLRSAAEILGENPPESDRIRFLGHIRSETERIQRVVDQMLVLSELEGKDALERREDIHLSRLVEDVVAGRQPLAQMRRIQFDVIVDRCEPVRGDASLLQTAIGSVVQNAIEFSPEGGKIRVFVGEIEGQFGWSVSDEGEGVPEYARSRVFERLFSLPRPDTGKKSSGLGLALAWEIAKLHGARIEMIYPTSGGTTVRWIFEQKG